MKESVFAVREQPTHTPASLEEPEMKRLLATCSLIVVASAIAFSASASVPQATTKAEAYTPRCITLHYGGTRYVFYKRGIRCGKAKRWAKRVHRTQGRWEPRGYRCNSGTRFRKDGACERSRRKIFLWYPEH